MLRHSITLLISMGALSYTTLALATGTKPKPPATPHHHIEVGCKHPSHPQLPAPTPKPTTPQPPKPTPKPPAPTPQPTPKPPTATPVTPAATPVTPAATPVTPAATPVTPAATPAVTETTATPTPSDSPAPQVAVKKTSSESKARLKKRIEPLFYLDFDFGQNLTNMTRQPGYEELKDRNTLVIGDYKDGFQRTKYFQFGLGIGAKQTYWYENASGLRSNAWGIVGVLPIYNRSVQATYFVAKASHEKPDRNRIPQRAPQLYAWAAGDNMTYSASGGVVFVPALGIAGIGVTVNPYLVTGQWQIYIEKMEGQKVYGKYTKESINGLFKYQGISASFGTAFASVSLGKFGSQDEAFSFVFDLNLDEGRKAYEDFVGGNLIAVKQLAEKVLENNVSLVSVQKLETIKTKTISRDRHLFVGVPILLNTVYGSSRVSMMSTTELHVEGVSMKGFYGMTSESRDSRMWNLHESEKRMFYGSRYHTEVQASKATDSGYFGRFSYNYNDENTEVGELDRVLTRLASLTGYKELLVGVPVTKESLEYVGVTLDITFNEQITKKLIQMAANSKIEAFSLNFVAHANGCNTKGELQDNTCTDDNTIYALYEMYTALRKMDQAMRAKDKSSDQQSQDFVQAYGEFGQGFMRNADAFAAVLKTAGAGVMIEYKIEGTKLSQLERSYVSNAKGGLIRSMPADEKAQAFVSPRFRRSQVKGLIFGRGLAYPSTQKQLR